MTPRLSIVAPLFNEEENLPVFLDEIRSALSQIDYEVLFVDDGSTDGSLQVLRGLARTDDRVRIVRHQANAGLSAALSTGIFHGRGEFVVTLDTDLQNDPADIPRLLEALENYDVVCGVRTDRRDNLLRKLSSRVANTVRNWLTAERIPDVGCTLRAYRRASLEGIPWFDGMHRFLPTLLRLNGASIAYLPVNHRPRRYGESKYNVRNRLGPALRDLFAVRWMQRRWISVEAEEVEPKEGGR